MSKIEDLIIQCKELLKEDNYPDVIIKCKQILEIDSNNEFALRFMGISNYHLKNYEESVKYLEKVYQNNHENHKIIMDYGIVLSLVGKLDKALSLYDSFDSEEYDEKYKIYNYFTNLSEKCEQRNKRKDAIKCLDYCLRFNINVSKLINNKRGILLSLKDFDGVSSCYDLLIDYEEDEENLGYLYYGKILCIEAKALNLYYKYLEAITINYPKDIVVQPNNYSYLLDDAMKLYSKSLEKYRENEYINDEKLGQWYNFLSTVITKYADDSYEFFENLFDLNEDNTELWCNKIYSNYHFKEYAIKYCDILLKSNPNAIQILNMKARLFEFDNEVKSLRIYEKALEINPLDNTAINGKLEMLYWLKWDEKAYAYLKSLSGNLRKIKNIDDIANLLKRKGKYSKAIECYEKILEINGFDISAITNIKKTMDEAGMDEAKNNSKYYMDWIDVILSRKKWSHCSKDGCYEQLYHIVPGLNGLRLLEVSKENKDILIKDYIDCDEDATHYCPNCKTIYKFDVERFNYNKDDPILYEYAKTLILAVKHQIYRENSNDVSYKELAEYLFKEYHLDKREYKNFINKLEELGYVYNIISLSLL